jgi:hypothetical protein
MEIDEVKVKSEGIIYAGAIVWTEDEYLAETDFTVTATKGQLLEAKYDENTDTFSVETDGVCAQEIDTKIWIIPYVETANGIVYGTAKNNNVMKVVRSTYTKGGANEKSMARDILNYATAARNYFVIKGDLAAPAEAFNATLPAEEQKLNFSDSLYATRATASIMETSSSYKPATDGVYANIQASILLRFVFKDASVKGIIYWKGDAYTGTTIHDQTTKTGDTILDVQGIYVGGVIPNIYSYNIYDDFYVRGYNEAGEFTKTYTHSIAAYATNNIKNPTGDTQEEKDALVELCKALLIYGNNAMNNDAVNKG